MFTETQLAPEIHIYYGNKFRGVPRENIMAYAQTSRELPHLKSFHRPSVEENITGEKSVGLNGEPEILLSIILSL